MLGRTETLKAQDKADRTGSHREGFREKMPEQEFKHMLRPCFHEKGVTQIFRLFFA